jgi:hypothetical protein
MLNLEQLSISDEKLFHKISEVATTLPPACINCANVRAALTLAFSAHQSFKLTSSQALFFSFFFFRIFRNEMRALGLLLFMGLPAQFQAVGSDVWYFPGLELQHAFLVNPLPLPASFTIETWFYMPYAEKHVQYWMSYATAGDADCFKMNANYVSLNVWTHAIITYDGTTTKEFYDGVERTPSNPVKASCVGPNTVGSLAIGQDQDSMGGWIDKWDAPTMFLDTVAVYDRAWTDVEVADKTPNTCVDTSDPNLYGLWYDSAGTDHLGGHSASVVSQTTEPGQYGYCADGSCFHGDGTVLLESGTTKKLSKLSIGDVIKTSNRQGEFSFNPVLKLPHAENSETATFLNLTTETGKSVFMTPDHFIPKCNFHEVTASELVVGDCLLTMDGKETLMEIESAKKKGVYTAITQDEFIMVDGVVASPFSKKSRPSKSFWDFAKHGADLKREQTRLVGYFENFKAHFRGNRGAL